MKPYRVDQKSKTEFTVVEQCSDLVIKSYPTSAEAHKFKKHLNQGGGFAGFTPPFILVKVA